MPEALERVEQQSVQKLPDAKTGEGGSTLWTAYPSSRQALLPSWATRERERALRLLWHHDDNLTFKSGVSGLIKRIQSTPYELKTPKQYGDYFQNILQTADFENWDQFVSKLLIDFFRQDAGAYIEIIGPGDPLEAITGAPTGIAVLDSLRCYPTGDPVYPVVYSSQDGSLHLMHYTRVVRFIDTMDTDDYVRGYGSSALSRAASAVWREILMTRYVQTQLDDTPPPGVAIFNNLSEQQYFGALEKRDVERQTDAGAEWGRTIKMFGVNPANPASVNFTRFSNPPEAWSYNEYTELNVRQIALALGVDMLDLWELTGNGIGTATQSEVMNQKSKGKSLGRILKSLERVINQILPDDAQFEFKYRDPEEDIQQAELANSWAMFVTTAGEFMSQQQKQELLANQVEAFRDAVTDIEGNIVRYDDSDDDNPEGQTIPDEDVTVATENDTENVATTSKEVGATRKAFEREFAEIVRFYRDGAVTKAGGRAGVRGVLTRRGCEIYRDGLRDGGREEPTIDAQGEQAVRVWRAKQTDFIRKFFDEAADLTDEQIRYRAHLWVNMSLDPLYYEGLKDANPRQKYMWVVDPTKEHCVTCLKLNGQVHTIDAFHRIGVLPKSRRLVCGGWNCGCTITKTNVPARGRLRGVRYVRREHEHHHHDLTEITEYLIAV